MNTETLVGWLFLLYVIGVVVYFFREVNQEVKKIGKALESPRVKRVIEGLAGLGIANWAFKKARQAKTPEEKSFYAKLAKEGTQMASKASTQSERKDSADWWKEPPKNDDEDEEPPTHNRFGFN